MADLLHFEDFEVGQVMPLGPYPVTAAEIIAFAAEFDPQDFHLDDEAGRASILGGLSASGWHVCAMLMRMIADGWLNQCVSMGSNSVPDMKWLKPVRPGDTLTGTVVIEGKRVSAKRPEMGIFQCRSALFNQHGIQTTEMMAVIFMGVRNP